nr:hypothetical protein [Tanacetum cinerariifolium]
MSQKPGHVTPVDYTKLNALYDQFVPQKELSKEQFYWLSASDIASQSSDPPKPVTHFVHTRLVNSEIFALLCLLLKGKCFKDQIAGVKNFNPPTIGNTQEYLNLKLKFQNYKECLRNQKEKDDTIRHLYAEKDILGLMNVGSTESSFKTKALETKISQLKEGLTSLKIQNDGFKVTNTNLNKCYHELSKANTHLRNTSLEKIATQKAEIATLKAEAVGKKNSGPTGTPTKPQVLASRMYTKSSKYIPPQKRADWVQPTLLPKKKQVTFLEPHRTSPRSTQKPPVQHKKPTVPVNMFPKAKPATEARKPIPKRNTQNHNPLPAKSVKARRAADSYMNLYVDISQFVDRSTKSMHTKPHQAKHVVNTSTNAWNATKNTVARIVSIWKPTGRRFNLHDIFGSRTFTEPIVKPSKLTPCVSPSTNATLSLEPILEPVELSTSVSSCASLTITMVSRFSDYRLNDRKAGSNGISSIFY